MGLPARCNSTSRATPRSSATSSSATVPTIAPIEHAGAELTVDLGAVAANWRALAMRVGGAPRCAATIKADAYGLGAVPVGRALAAAGCRWFFVFTLDEGLTLRQALPDVEIVVLLGPLGGSEAAFRSARLIPVLNTLEQVNAWRGAPAALHIDTGLNRLGVPLRDVERLIADGWPTDLPLALTLSHLARADEPNEPMNEAQRRAFDRIRSRLPAAPASLANSAGVFLGPDFHLDLARPGYAICGGNPRPGQPNPMRHVVELTARIVQVRDVDRGESVGYGAAHRAQAPARIATVPIGYADGYRRGLGGRGTAYVQGQPVAVVGRVSMDLVTLDVSHLPEHVARVGAEVEMIGANATIDALAEAAGTIGFEILTGLGRRMPRRYLGP